MPVIITRTDEIANLPDGIYFDQSIGEHRVIVSGQTVNYATHWSTAVYQFKEACRVRREHLRNNQEMN